MGRAFHVVFQKGESLVFSLVKHLVTHFVERERHLLVFGVGEEILGMKVALFFVGNHLLHQFHSRVVLATVSCSFGGDSHACQRLGICHQLHCDVLVLAKILQANRLCLITH